jgi:hypothetical protein
MGCYGFKSDTSLLKFLRNVMPPSSGSKYMSKKQRPFDHEDGSIVSLRNVNKFLPDYTASHPLFAVTTVSTYLHDA